MLWLFLPLACGAGVLGFGGPPAPYDELTPAERAAVREAVGLPPLPGRGVLHYPKVHVEQEVPARWRFVERAHPVRVHPVRAVSFDDLEKLSSHEQPPLEYAFPVEFREYDMPLQVDGEGRLEETLPVAVPATVAAEPAKGLVSWLPQRIQGWLPSLPSLSAFVPHLPDFLPGFDFEAEVHRKPTRVPHIPTPNELVKDFNSVVDRALNRLHHKQEQLLEVIKCACPRPARCEGLLQEFLGRPPAAGATPADGGEPSVSVFGELTKPDGSHGTGFGFFVDKEGPHLGHHVHNPAASAASAQPSPATAAPPPAGGPASASAQSAALASSSDGPASASAQSAALASSSGGPASASATSSATASSGGRADAADSPTVDSP